jgi:hypothetical protein
VSHVAADSGNQAIRKVNATGFITTPISLNSSHYPVGVLAAPDGSVYFTDRLGSLSEGWLYQYSSNAPLRKLKAGSSLSRGLDMHPVTGQVYVVGSFAENSQSTVISVNVTANTSEPAFTLLWPTGVSPGDIAFNASSGYAFMHGSSTTIYKWKYSNPQTLELLNTGSSKPSSGASITSVKFKRTMYIDADAGGNLLLSDTDCCLVWLVDAQNGLLRQVAGIDVASVTDPATCQPQCAAMATVNASHPTHTRLNSPTGVAFGPGGWSAYIVEQSNDRVLKVVLECVTSCAVNPCQNVAGSNGTCIDQKAPNTGFTCACNAGRAWNGSACAGKLVK